MRLHRHFFATLLVSSVLAIGICSKGSAAAALPAAQSASQNPAREELVKRTNSGSGKWPLLGYGNKVAVVPDGGLVADYYGVYVSAYYHGKSVPFGSKTFPSPDKTDTDPSIPVLFKVGLDGTPKWLLAATAVGESGDIRTTIKAGGDIFVAGQQSGLSLGGVPLRVTKNHGNSCGYIARVDAGTGKVKASTSICSWVEKLGTVAVQGISIDAVEGFIYVAGEYAGSFDDNGNPIGGSLELGGHVFHTDGFSDTFIAKLGMKDFKVQWVSAIASHDNDFTKGGDKLTSQVGLSATHFYIGMTLHGQVLKQRTPTTNYTIAYNTGLGHVDACVLRISRKTGLVDAKTCIQAEGKHELEGVLVAGNNVYAALRYDSVWSVMGSKGKLLGPFKSNGLEDLAIIRMGPALGIQAVHAQIGGDNSDFFTSMAFDASSNTLAITMLSSSNPWKLGSFTLSRPAGPIPQNVVTVFGVIATFDGTSLDTKAAVPFGGTTNKDGQDYIYASGFDNTGCLFLAGGTTQDKLTVGTKTYTNSGKEAQDLVIVRLSKDLQPIYA